MKKYLSQLTVLTTFPDLSITDIVSPSATILVHFCSKNVFGRGQTPVVDARKRDDRKARQQFRQSYKP